MTTLLKKAFKEASRLSEMDQNAIAQWLLDELRSEKSWYIFSDRLISHPRIL